MRNLNELIGIIKGVSFDGIVNEKEVERLRIWVGKNRNLAYDSLQVNLISLVDDVIADNIVLLSSGDASSGNYNSQPQSQTQARNNNPKGDVYISPMPGGDFGGFNDDNFGGDFSRGFDDLNSGFGGFDPKNNDVNNNDDGDSESNLPF